jgi:hypothetical protein
MSEEKIIVRGSLQRAEGPSSTGRVYAKGLMERELARLEEKVRAGEVGTAVVENTNPAFKVTGVDILEPSVTAETRNTPEGRKLARRLLHGAMSFSMGVRGTINERGELAVHSVGIVPVEPSKR